MDTEEQEQFSIPIDNSMTTSEVTEIPVDDDDFYAVLGVARDATEKQITMAFKKLSLKYHPDRQTDGADAEQSAKRFAAVQSAYAVLSDANKRRQYDLKDEAHTSATAEAAEVPSLAGISRVFGAVINKLGLPIVTQISTDVVVAAQEICRDGGIEGGGPPLDPRVSDIPWGWTVESKVDRQAGVFYRLTIDATNAEKGFVVNCRSFNKSKFKLILFDSEGNILHQEESFKEKDKNYTQATFFFTQFDTYRLDEAKTTDKTIPPLFNRLDSLVPSRKSIKPGQVLLCVYGDNFIGKTNFSIIAVPAKTELPDVKRLEETDEQLLDLKRGLESTKAKYLQAKAAYDAVLAKMKTEQDRLDELLRDRERNYTAVLDHAIGAFNPLDTTTHNPSSAEDLLSTSDKNTAAASEKEPTESTSAVGSLFGLWGSATTTATAVSANAAQTATAATGWLARRLSLIVQPVIKEETAIPAGEAAPSLNEEPKQENISTTPVLEAPQPQPETPVNLEIVESKTEVTETPVVEAEAPAETENSSSAAESQLEFLEETI